jgi:hypothetical protein
MNKKLRLLILFVVIMIPLAFSYSEPPYIPVTKPIPIINVTICASGCNYSDLNDAENNVAPGWLILLKAGTYNGIQWSLDGEPEKEIRIEPFNTSEVVYIKGQFRISGANIILDGGPNRNLKFIRNGLNEEALVRIDNDNITLSRLHIIGPTGLCNNSNNAGILMNTWKFADYYSAEKVRIYNTKIENASHKGMYIHGARDTEIRNNIIMNTEQNGLQLNPHDNNVFIKNLTIAGNFLVNNGHCEAMVGHNMYIQGDSDSLPIGIRNVSIYNNIFINANRSGIHIVSSVINDSINIFNNNFYNNKDGISFDGVQEVFIRLGVQ